MHECDACGLIFGGTEGCPSCGSMVSHSAPVDDAGVQEKPSGSLPGGVQLQESMEGIDGLETLSSKASSEATDLPFQLGGSSGGVTSLPFGMGSPSGGLEEEDSSVARPVQEPAPAEPATEPEPAEPTAEPQPAPALTESEAEPVVVHLDEEEPVVLVARIEGDHPSTPAADSTVADPRFAGSLPVEPTHTVDLFTATESTPAEMDAIFAEEEQVVYHDFGDELQVSEVIVDFDSLVDPAEAAVSFDPERFHDGQPELVPARALPLEALDSDMQALADKGFAALGAAEWEAAATEFRAICEQRPQDAAALNNFGLALLQQALLIHTERPSADPATEPHFEAAVLALRQAAKARQDDVAILTNLATSLTSCLRHEAALMVYDAALHIDGHDSAANNGKAVSLIGLRRFDEAVAVLRQTAVRTPGNRVILENLRRVSPMG